ncbi:unnamed protein product, partial [Rotaria socialis]
LYYLLAMTVSLLLIASLLLPHCMNVEARNSALCYLSYRPAAELLEFAQQLAEDAIQYGVEIFIMVDDNNFNISAINTSSNVRLLQISREKCLRHNYHKAINTGGTWQYITSWDKALLYFCALNQNYSFVWFLEEDVFIPSVQAFRSLHELYSNTTDLIVPRHELNLIGSDGLWLWIMASGKFLPPWACSMANAVGFSRRMLIAMDQFVQWLGEVPFHEFFFNTLAVQLNFTIVTPTELNTIEYAKVFFYKDIREQPNNMWHPIKDFPKGKMWRTSLVNETSKHNNTFDLDNLEMLCHGNQTMTNIEQHLKDLFVRFEISKSNFSSNVRRLWRQRFSDLAEECQKRNVSQEIVSFAIKLADHAYKLPEPPVPELVRIKSTNHIRLEREINEMKQAIYQSSSNSTTVTELRKQATNLIKKLTVEIRQEIVEEEKLRKQTTTLSTLSITSSFSTTTTTTTTIRSFSIANTTISSLSSSTQVTIVMVNGQLDKVQRQHDHQMFDRVKTRMCSVGVNTEKLTTECTVGASRWSTGHSVGVVGAPLDTPSVQVGGQYTDTAHP